MAFNPFTFLRLGGLLPGLAGLVPGALQAMATRFGTTAVATRMAVVILRTAGFLQKRSGFVVGLPLPSTPATRLLPTVFPFPIPIASFLEGFAYENTEELTDGWLSFFGEFVLKDVPGVEGEVEKGIAALGRGDFITFGEVMAEAVAEDVGLAAVSAFFRGVAQVERDFQELGLPTGNPAPWFFSSAIGGIAWLDKLFTDTGRFLGGLVPQDEELDLPPTIGDELPLDPAFRRALEEMEGGVPTTEKQVRAVGQLFSRFRKRIPDLARIIDLLKRTA